MVNKQRLEKIDKKLDMIMACVEHPVKVGHAEDFNPDRHYGGILIIRPLGCK